MLPRLCWLVRPRGRTTSAAKSIPASWHKERSPRPHRQLQGLNLPRAAHLQPVPWMGLGLPLPPWRRQQHQAPQGPLPPAPVNPQQATASPVKRLCHNGGSLPQHRGPCTCSFPHAPLSTGAEHRAAPCREIGSRGLTGKPSPAPKREAGRSDHPITQGSKGHRAAPRSLPDTPGTDIHVPFKLPSTAHGKKVTLNSDFLKSSLSFPNSTQMYF